MQIIHSVPGLFEAFSFPPTGEKRVESDVTAEGCPPIRLCFLHDSWEAASACHPVT